jgi:hypothetical protein
MDFARIIHRMGIVPGPVDSSSYAHIQATWRHPTIACPTLAELAAVWNQMETDRATNEQQTASKNAVAGTIRQALSTALQEHLLIEQNWASLTTAERTLVIRKNNRSLIRLIRLTIEALDAD